LFVFKYSYYEFAFEELSFFDPKTSSAAVNHSSISPWIPSAAAVTAIAHNFVCFIGHLPPYCHQDQRLVQFFLLILSAICPAGSSGIFFKASRGSFL
jgi:hypothetical protein